ncbi:hypothetical protein KAFR_0J02670 [Kazachstania africana CBS 2517]|uniref:Monopolin complex subunit Csm1/Pcs1 C-terminal domain-containing protein n=1 Tax=Kazachstania africana (strain ATCC 22294 / BCRC 22015 / CBS 2517 / CECT 1963 / NBRC 1671 / NRRL Y-8276) TaxID=1071382 RepID=H2B131_KAZAF|nr:hypothetical protein KAFR_0J02670 [Kazachstania africana CBS 2517]CCF60331.1 hypothetical protein KAFR_0J02670 [Kazachstania africana CBS 2517]
MEALIEYKESVKEQLENADLLITKLVNENSTLNEKLRVKDDRISNLENEIANLKQQVVKTQQQLKDKAENIDVIKDLFEHLCGVRVHKSYEDDTGLWFDTSQGSKKGIMDYKLGFVKGENASTEVIYVPLLKQRSTEELKTLQGQLPSYMFDTLSFPLNSLNQFYIKLSKCLNKSKQ